MLPIKKLTKKKLIFIAIIIAGSWNFGTGIYIYTKAQLAQYLLNSAWTKTATGMQKVKPWKWADTYPVAKIYFKDFKKKYIILAGANGRTMAFGPGHLSSSPLPGSNGNSVIVGHRDTHFKVLKNLNQDDEIYIQTQNENLSYRVSNIFIVNQKQTDVMQNNGEETLTLITCYPFDSLNARGPLRFVVQAELI